MEDRSPEKTITPLLSSFIEIHPRDQTLDLPNRLDVVITSVEPKHCNKLLKELSYFLPMNPSKTSSNSNVKDAIPMEEKEEMDSVDLNHLRRIRNKAKLLKQKNKYREAPIASPKRKKNKSDHSQPKSLSLTPKSIRLDVILSTPSILKAKCSPETIIRLKAEYNLTAFETISVPGRSANSKEELEEWNTIWPTIYFHRKTTQHLLESLALSKDEIELMKNGMKEAIKDCQNIQQEIFSRENKSLTHPLSRSNVPGVVIINPETNQIISNSHDELLMQRGLLKNRFGSLKWDPLSTSILLAIQGVSRRERSNAMKKGMQSEEFQKGQVSFNFFHNERIHFLLIVSLIRVSFYSKCNGFNLQYLCTGYDVYVTKEPNIYEAMALTHSRVRRVIYGSPDKYMGGLGGTGDENAVHCLPGTNHHFRVFHCNKNDNQCDLWGICEQFHT